MTINKPTEGKANILPPEETVAVPVEAETEAAPKELSAEDLIAQIKAEDERLKREAKDAEEKKEQERLQREQTELTEALQTISGFEVEIKSIQNKIDKEYKVEMAAAGMRLDLIKQNEAGKVPAGERSSVGPRIQSFDKSIAEYYYARRNYEEQRAAIQKQINELKGNRLVQIHEQDRKDRDALEKSVRESERIAAEKATEKAEFEAKVEAFEKTYAEAKAEIDKAAKNWVDFWKVDNGWALRLNSEGATGLKKEEAPLYQERDEINQRYPNAASELEQIKDSWFKGSRRAELQRAIDRMSALEGQIEKIEKIRIETQENESKLGKLLNSKLHEIEEKCRPFTTDEKEIARMFDKKIKQDLSFYQGEDYFHNYGDFFKAYGYDRAEAIKGK